MARSAKTRKATKGRLLTDMGENGSGKYGIGVLEKNGAKWNRVGCHGIKCIRGLIAR